LNTCPLRSDWLGPIYYRKRKKEKDNVERGERGGVRIRPQLVKDNSGRAQSQLVTNFPRPGGGTGVKNTRNSDRERTLWGNVPQGGQGSRRTLTKITEFKEG